MNVVKQFKSFRVVAVSRNHNSFGLAGHVLLARDGEAWEVGRSIASPEPWHKGDDVRIELDKDNMPVFVGCELPRRLLNPPKALLAEIYS